MRDAATKRGFRDVKIKRVRRLPGLSAFAGELRGDAFDGLHGSQGRPVRVSRGNETHLVVLPFFAGRFRVLLGSWRDVMFRDRDYPMTAAEIALATSDSARKRHALRAVLNDIFETMVAAGLDPALRRELFDEVMTLTKAGYRPTDVYGRDPHVAPHYPPYAPHYHFQPLALLEDRPVIVIEGRPVIAARQLLVQPIGREGQLIGVALERIGNAARNGRPRPDNKEVWQSQVGLRPGRTPLRSRTPSGSTVGEPADPTTN
jgi:hypothetical protein